MHSMWKKGHSNIKCWEVIGYPPGHPKVKSHPQKDRGKSGIASSRWNKGKQQGNKSAANVQSSNQSESGVSSASTSSQFTMQQIEAMLRMMLENGLSLRNALYVPSFKHNLLSVNKLLQDSKCRVQFYAEYCVIEELQSSVVKGIGMMKNGLYNLKNDPIESVIQELKEEIMSRAECKKSEKNAMSTCTYNNVPSIVRDAPVLSNRTLWHYRLGHAPYARIQKIHNLKGVKSRSTNVCLTCPLEKFTKLPYSLSDSRAKEPFELVHLDTWGPYRVPAKGKYKYFLTLVDDYSRVTWINLIIHKSDAFKKPWIDDWDEGIENLRENLSPNTNTTQNEPEFKPNTNTEPEPRNEKTSEFESEPPNNMPVRKSGRQSKPPVWHKDYKMGSVSYAEEFHGKDETQNGNRVCKLNKSLYGLKQAPRQWYAKLSSALINYGYRQSKTDHTLFTHQSTKGFVAILVYVDDLIVTRSNLELIVEEKKYLDTQFHMKDMGELRYFLGIEVDRTKRGIFLSQKKYVKDILNEYNLSDCKPLRLPMDCHVKLTHSTRIPLEHPEVYQRLVGKLIYLTITRPDIAFTVHNLSQFMHSPTSAHFQAAKRVLRYLSGSSDQGILLSSDKG
uniref:Reverse transcriptase Ty1/copia-type domain-containing protein n=1 Tax=Chenopodium quinoa TaxID=63459 RepID=A0A803KUG9_CHEQI